MNSENAFAPKRWSRLLWVVAGVLVAASGLVLVAAAHSPPSPLPGAFRPVPVPGPGEHHVLTALRAAPFASPTIDSGAEHISTNASAPCAQWRLATDFRVAPDQENPNRDSCGNPGVWHLMQSTDWTRDPQTYALLPYFTSSSSGIQGLELWTGTDWAPPPEGLPSIGINNTGVTQTIDGHVWPPDAISAHPSDQRLAIASWQSPLSGGVMITGYVHDLDSSCGDGVLWYIDQGATNLASGSIASGASQHFRDGTGGDNLAEVTVIQGEFIYVAIHPNADLYCDATELDILITLLEGVYLSPANQSGSGAPGATVTYTVNLANQTAITDSFALTLGSHVWDTALSTGDLGPIASGESMTFSVSVTLPVAAGWYSTDTVVVTATSVASPTVYSGTAVLTTQAYAPPEIHISPAVLRTAQQVNEITTHTLTISNGNGITLTFTSRGVAHEGLVLWNELGSDGQVQHSQVGENGTLVGTDYAYEPAQHGNGYVRKAMGQNYVLFPAAVLDGLTHRGTIEMWINPKVPNPVPYEYGVFGLIGAPFGHGDVPGDWNVGLFWGDTVTFRGLVGEIRFDENRATTPDEPTQFVAEPYEPFHAAICWDIEGIGGTNDTVRVYRDGSVVGSTTALWNPNGTERYDMILGYGPDGGGYDKFITDNIQIWDHARTDFSGRFSESPLTPWMTVSPVSGTVATASSTSVHVTCDATGLQPGGYTAEILVGSNDPLTPTVQVGVTMTVEPTPDMGRVSGAVSDAWTGRPLTATVELVGVFSMTARPEYTLWAPAGTYSLTAFASGYYTLARPVSITAGGVVSANLALEPAQARAEWSPSTITATAVEGMRVTQTLTIANSGPLPLNVALHEIGPTVARRAASPTGLTGKRSPFDDDRARGERAWWPAGRGYTDDVPWLSESPVTGTIPGHGVLLVELEFDARTLAPGTQQAILAIEHNDPARPSPAELPVTLSVVARQAAVSLAPALQERSGLPGATVVYTLTVANTGNFTDTFSLDASGVWTPTLRVESAGPLRAGASGVFTLGVTIPGTATLGGSDTTLIVARSTFDPDVSTSAEAITSVAAPPQWALFLPVMTKNHTVLEFDID